MSEWGIPFDHIETHWTNRQLQMHAARLAERMDANTRANKAKHGSVSSRDFLKQQGYV